MTKVEFINGLVCAVVVFGTMMVTQSPVQADEAPTILIEDVILTCTAQNQSGAMPSVSAAPIDQGTFERRFHRVISKTCQGQTVCRIAAAPLLTPALRNSTCDDVVIVPVCAVGAFENVTPGASTEMTLFLRDDGYLVINCSGRANPHF